MRMIKFKIAINRALSRFGYIVTKLQSIPVSGGASDDRNIRFEKWANRGEPSFDDDNIVTWYQSVDFLTDSRLKRAYDLGMSADAEAGNPAHDGLNTPWRVAMACWFAHHATKIPGDFVECGVCTGATSLAVCDYVDFNKLQKSFYLFDTYDGIPLEQARADEAERADLENKLYYRECYDQVCETFSGYQSVHVVRGRVPDTLLTVNIEKVSYLHIDMNIAAPERAAIEYFWPKMSSGGIIFLDDYGWTPFRLQKEALDDFARSRGVEIMMLPTGQGLLLKP